MQNIGTSVFIAFRPKPVSQGTDKANTSTRLNHPGSDAKRLLATWVFLGQKKAPKMTPVELPPPVLKVCILRKKYMVNVYTYIGTHTHLNIIIH